MAISYADAVQTNSGTVTNDLSGNVVASTLLSAATAGNTVIVEFSFLGGTSGFTPSDTRCVMDNVCTPVTGMSIQIWRLPSATGGETSFSFTPGTPAQASWQWRIWEFPPIVPFTWAYNVWSQGQTGGASNPTSFDTNLTQPVEVSGLLTLAVHALYGPNLWPSVPQVNSLTNLDGTVSDTSLQFGSSGAGTLRSVVGYADMGADWPSGYESGYTTDAPSNPYGLASAAVVYSEPQINIDYARVVIA